MSFRTLPKVELHTHLEGCAPPEFISGLAAEKKIDISRIFDADGGYAFRDFDHFLKVYEAACTTLQTPEDFRRLTLAVLEETAPRCGLYGNLCVARFLRWRRCGGVARLPCRDGGCSSRGGKKSLGSPCKGIVTGIRHFGPDACKPAARCAAETSGDFIVGFGMAGGEMVGRARRLSPTALTWRARRGCG